MPTAREWQQALSREYQLIIESSSSLCNEVLGRQNQRDIERRQSGRISPATKALRPWPKAGGLSSVKVRPIEILQSLGRITTPVITELIDLASTWAEIRYVWAFRPNFTSRFARTLRLSPAVKELDFHQKTLLSDEFGVAFAAYYMARFENATDPIDAFVARRNRQVRLVGNSRRSVPDYIFSGPQPEQYFVVECKGTQGPRTTAVGQLQRGSEQVVTVALDPPAKAIRLVIGAVLSGSMTLLILDPDEDENEGNRTLARWSTEEIRLFSCAKRLTYIGDNVGAARLLDRRHFEFPLQEPWGETEMSIRENDLGVFLGTEEQRRTPDGHQIRMFRGIEKLTLEAVRDGVPKARLLNAGRLPEIGSAEHDESPFHVETSSGPETAIVRSIASDGSIFEVSIG